MSQIDINNLDSDALIALYSSMSGGQTPPMEAPKVPPAASRVEQAGEGPAGMPDLVQLQAELEALGAYQESDTEHQRRRLRRERFKRVWIDYSPNVPGPKRAQQAPAGPTVEISQEEADRRIANDPKASARLDRRLAAAIERRWAELQVEAAGPEQNLDDALTGAISRRVAGVLEVDPKVPDQIRTQAQDYLRDSEIEHAKKKMEAEHNLARQALTHPDGPAKFIADYIGRWMDEGLTPGQIDQRLEAGGWPTDRISAKQLAKLDDWAQIEEDLGDLKRARSYRRAKIELLRHAGAGLEILSPQDIDLLDAEQGLKEVLRQAPRLGTVYDGQNIDQLHEQITRYQSARGGGMTRREAFGLSFLRGMMGTTMAIQRYITGGEGTKLLPEAVYQDFVRLSEAGMEKHPVTGTAGMVGGFFFDPVLAGINGALAGIRVAGAGVKATQGAMATRGAVQGAGTAQAARVSLSVAAREKVAAHYMAKLGLSARGADLAAGFTVSAAENAVIGAGLAALEEGSYYRERDVDPLKAGAVGFMEGLAAGVFFEGLFRGSFKLVEIAGNHIPRKVADFIDEGIGRARRGDRTEDLELRRDLERYMVGLADEYRAKGGRPLTEEEAAAVAVKLGMDLDNLRDRVQGVDPKTRVRPVDDAPEGVRENVKVREAGDGPAKDQPATPKDPEAGPPAPESKTESPATSREPDSPAQESGGARKGEAPTDTPAQSPRTDTPPEKPAKTEAAPAETPEPGAAPPAVRTDITPPEATGGVTPAPVPPRPPSGGDADAQSAESSPAARTADPAVREEITPARDPDEPIGMGDPGPPVEPEATPLYVDEATLEGMPADEVRDLWGAVDRRFRQLEEEPGVGDYSYPPESETDRAIHREYMALDDLMARIERVEEKRTRQAMSAEDLFDDMRQAALKSTTSTEELEELVTEFARAMKDPIRRDGFDPETRIKEISARSPDHEDLLFGAMQRIRDEIGSPSAELPGQGAKQAIAYIPASVREAMKEIMARPRGYRARADMEAEANVPHGTSKQEASSGEAAAPTEARLEAQPRGGETREIQPEAQAPTPAKSQTRARGGDSGASSRGKRPEDDRIEVEGTPDGMTVWAFGKDSLPQIKKLVDKANRIKGAGRPSTGRVPSIKPIKPTPKAAKTQGELVKGLYPMRGSTEAGHPGLHVDADGNAWAFGSASGIVLRGMLKDAGDFAIDKSGALKPLPKKEQLHPDRIRDRLNGVEQAIRIGKSGELHGQAKIDALLRDVQKARILSDQSDGGKSVHLYKNPGNADDPFGFVTNGSRGASAVNTWEDSIEVGLFDPDRLIEVLRAMATAGVQDVEIRFDTSPPKAGEMAKPMVLSGYGVRTISGTVEAAVMPKRINAPSAAQTSAKPSGVQQMARPLDPIDPTIPGERDPRVDTWVREDPSTPQTRRVYRKILRDPDGNRVGIFSILREFDRDLRLLALNRREQTTFRSPANYLRYGHVRRARDFGAAYNFHEQGHALAGLLDEHPEAIRKALVGMGYAGDEAAAWRKAFNDELMELVYARGSMASRETAEEGFAEFVRRYISDPHSTARTYPFTPKMEKVIAAADPKYLEAMRNAARSFRAHASRSLFARSRALRNDVLAPSSRVREHIESGLVSFLQQGLVTDLMVRDAKRAILKAPGNPKEKRRLLRQFEDRVGDTAADPYNSYQQLKHIEAIIGLALYGGGRKTKIDKATGSAVAPNGLRVHATMTRGQMEEGRGIFSQADRAKLEEAGFTMIPREPSGHGELVHLYDRNLADLEGMIEKGQWTRFEHYAQWKAEAARVRKRIEDNQERIANDEDALPISWPGQSEGITLGDMISEVERYEADHPEWVDVFGEFQRLSESVLVLNMMTGEISVDDAIAAFTAYDHYVPLTRVGEAGPAPLSFGGSTHPKGMAGRSRGSETAAEPLLTAMARKIGMAVNAYYWNRFMLAPILFAQEAKRMPDISPEVAVMAERVALPLRMDMKKVASLKESEIQEEIAKYIEQQIADGNPYFVAVHEGGAGAEPFTHQPVPGGARRIDPESITILKPGTPILRRMPPNAIRVVAPWVNGRREYWQINDPTLYQVFAQGQDVNKVLRGVQAVIQPVTQRWKDEITQTVDFAIRNLVRDPGTAIAFGPGPERFVPGIYHVVGLVAMLTGNAPEVTARPELLSRTFRHLHTDDFIRQRPWYIRDLLDGIVIDDWQHMSRLRKAQQIIPIANAILLKPFQITRIITGQRALSTLLESAPRVGAAWFEQQRGASPEAQQVAADTVTGNFGDHPGDPNFNAVAGMAGFLRPALNISGQWARLLSDPDPSRAAGAILGMAVSMSSAMALIWAIRELFFATESWEEREKERPEDDRVTHFTIGDARLPFDYGPGGVIQSLTMNLLDHAAGRNPVSRKALAKKVLQTVPAPVSIGNGASLAGEILPTPVRALIEVSLGEQGYNFYWRRPVVPDSLRYLPAPDQAFTDTPGLYRRIGAITNTSPIKIQHLVRNALSVQIDDALKFKEALDQGLVAEDGIERWFRVGRLVSRDPVGWHSRSTQTVADLDREFERTVTAIDQIVESEMLAGNYKSVEALFDAREDVQILAHKANQLRPMHEAYSYIREIYSFVKAERKKPDPDRDAIKRAEQDMVRVAQEALRNANMSAPFPGAENEIKPKRSGEDRPQFDIPLPSELK